MRSASLFSLRPIWGGMCTSILPRPFHLSFLNLRLCCICSTMVACRTRAPPVVCPFVWVGRCICGLPRPCLVRTFRGLGLGSMHVQVRRCPGCVPLRVMVSIRKNKGFQGTGFDVWCDVSNPTPSDLGPTETRIGCEPRPSSTEPMAFRSPRKKVICMSDCLSLACVRRRDLWVEIRPVSFFFLGSFLRGWTCEPSIPTKIRPGLPPEDGPRTLLFFQSIETSLVAGTNLSTNTFTVTTRTRAWTRGTGFERPCRKGKREHTGDVNLVHARNRSKWVQKKENQHVRRRTGSIPVKPTPTKPKRIPQERPKDPKRREKIQE